MGAKNSTLFVHQRTRRKTVVDYEHAHKEVIEETVTTIHLAITGTESSTNDITYQLKEFTDEAKKAIHATNSMLKEAKVRCGQHGTTLCSHLAQIAHKAYEYVDDVDDLYYYGRDKKRIQRVKEGIMQGDPTELKSFLDQLQYYIQKCESSYQEVKECFSEIEQSADRAASYCEEQGKKARNKKNTTKAVGGTAAAGALAAGVAGGVAASVIAGVFTFGVGTVVGLSLTAAGSIAAGSGIAAATGAVTHRIATNFEESEKAFKELSKSFGEVRSSAQRVLENACCIRTHLVTISKSVDNVERVKNSKMVRESLIEALDRLGEKFGEARTQSSECRSTMKGLKETMTG